MKAFKKAMTACAVFLVVAIVLVMLGCLAVFQIHLAIISAEPDQSGWVLTNERYEIRPQTENREIGFEVIEKESGKTVHTTGDNGYRQWDFKSIKILPDNNIEIVTGDMGKQLLHFQNGQWQYEH